MRRGNTMTDLKANSYLAGVEKDVFKAELSHMVRCAEQGVGVRVSGRRNHTEVHS